MFTEPKDDGVRKIWTLGITLLAMIAAVLILANAIGCARVCQDGAMRCVGTKAELCDTRGQWRVVMDCSKVEPKSKGWTCYCAKAEDVRCSCKVTP